MKLQNEVASGGNSGWYSGWCGFAVAGLLLSIIAGCGGPGATVTGQITVDGRPMSGVLVVFDPARGRASFGRTNDQGHYELQYDAQTKGTEPGETTVRITLDSSDDSGEISNTQIAPEFNEESTLVVKVDSGRNTLNFDVKLADPKLVAEHRSNKIKQKSRDSSAQMQTAAMGGGQ